MLPAWPSAGRVSAECRTASGGAEARPRIADRMDSALGAAGPARETKSMVTMTMRDGRADSLTSAGCDCCARPPAGEPLRRPPRNRTWAGTQVGPASWPAPAGLHISRSPVPPVWRAEGRRRTRWSIRASSRSHQNRHWRPCPVWRGGSLNSANRARALPSWRPCPSSSSLSTSFVAQWPASSHSLQVSTPTQADARRAR